MALRTVCMYNDQMIGIESIYTVRDGKKINIQGEVERIRELGRQNKLFCPCGCGSNYILVAGDKNLREQHFRIRRSNNKENCTFIEEGTKSIASKIMLKCWMDDKLESSHLESRVGLDRVSESGRKFEFTFFDFVNKLGICYWYKRENVISNKVNIINNFGDMYKTIYIADIHNAGEYKQYPEFMMKIQDKQGYNLYLNINECNLLDPEYEQAIMDVRVYLKNRKGEWNELVVISDKLCNYTFSEEIELKHNNRLIKDIAQEAIKEFEEYERQKLIDEDKARQERFRQEQLRREEVERQRNQTKRVTSWKKISREQNTKTENDRKSYTEIINQYNEQYYECEYCSKKSTEKDFVMTDKSTGIGICRECQRSGKVKSVLKPSSDNKIAPTRRNVCPECRGKLIKRISRTGTYFMGCENFPKCRYTESVRN